MAHDVVLIPGDGIGPEITSAMRRVVEATGVQINWNVQNAGAGVMDEFGTPLPEHVATWEGAEEARTNERHPLQMISHHFKGRTHSTYGNLSNNLEAHPQKIWINTRDAAARGIANDDVVKVFNDRGTIQCQALVTPRIVPGTVGIPQGAWHKADMFGDKIDIKRIGLIKPLVVDRQINHINIEPETGYALFLGYTIFYGIKELGYLIRTVIYLPDKIRIPFGRVFSHIRI